MAVLQDRKEIRKTCCSLCIMAKRKVEIGPTGETVRHNVARIRKRQGLTLQNVSDRLSTTDRPMSPNAISEIERAARRVDVDDLIALAVALNASPLALLLPPVRMGAYVTTITAAGMSPAADVWRWARGEGALRTGPAYESLPEGNRPAAADHQLVMHSDPDMQDPAGAPNIHAITDGEGPATDGDD